MAETFFISSLYLILLWPTRSGSPRCHFSIEVKALDLIKNMKLDIISVISGIIIGVILGVASYLAYTSIFHESSSEFYLFASLALIVSPLAGSMISALLAKKNKPAALLITGSVILFTLIVLSILSYLVLPLFFYESVQLPDTSRTGAHMPSGLNYPIPGAGTGTLIAEDNYSNVVVLSDYDHSPYASTVYLINKSGNKVLWRQSFNDDVIAAAIDRGTLNLFHDKIGYYINTENGEFVKTIVRLDNYWQLYTSSNKTYVQTTFETSVLNADGSVDSHQQMYMNSTALGYFICGSEGRIMK